LTGLIASTAEVSVLVKEIREALDWFDRIGVNPGLEHDQENGHDA